MLRRYGPLAVLFLITALIWFTRATGDTLLRDTDTIAAIKGIRSQPQLFYWFTHDWPLENHFYRPVSTLFFQFDLSVWGENAAGWGATNALICIGCIWALYWFLLELTATRWMAILSTALFGLWISGKYLLVADLLQYAWMPVLVGGCIRHGRSVARYLPAAFTTYFFGSLIPPLEQVQSRTLHWIPGRTATVMTLFFLLGLAAYARYERSGQRSIKEAGYLDPPNTKSSVFEGQIKFPWLFQALSLVFLLLALGSYEQAVMMPACFLGVSILMVWQGYRVRWFNQALFWGLLFGYLVFRSRVVPTQASGYQLQQFRNGPGVWISLFAFIAPGFAGIRQFLTLLQSGWLIFLGTAPWEALALMAGNVCSVWQLRTKWKFALGGYLLAILTFLPMAWLKMFEHYYFLPMAMWSLLVVNLGATAWESALSGWSPRELRAPKRSSLAPGSLPRL